MKTTLDGVVFLLPHVSGHAKTEFHSRRIFPRPREEGGNGMRRPGESCRTRTVGRQDEAAEQGGRTERQNGAARRSGKTDRQDGAAGRGGKTGRQDGAAGRSGRTERQDGAARRSGRTVRQDGAAEKEGEGKAGSSQRTGPGAPPAQTKKRARPSVPPVLAPGFQPPEAAGQRKSARRSGPASAKGQRTGSQYAVRTPGRVQYYPHGRR